MKPRALVKEVLGELPMTAEMYWFLRHRDGKAFNRFNLDALKANLPEMLAQVAPYSAAAQPGKKLFFFASMHIWINHAVVTSLVLRGMGHPVVLGYLPYSDFTRPVTKFDLRRNGLYARNVLRQAEPLLKSLSLLEVDPVRELPPDLHEAVMQITTFDTRYILQREEVRGDEAVFLLRRERNLDAARRALAYFQRERPETVIVPNGMILEYGAVYETARHLGIPVVTYEFGEQDQRIWIGQDRWVIHHRTEEMWAARKERKLSQEQRAWLETFLTGRQRSSTGSQFAHLWQKADRAGGARVRAALGLDERPVLLLPTNVLGDSATLGLTVFSRSMTEWLEKVLPVLAARSEVQVVIRIHPGETLTVGPSVMEIVERVLPERPAHIHLVGALEKINTYDLMEITDLALVYTTTAGLEMALRGIPVLVSGRAHYRGKDFTLDADSWEAYFQALDRAVRSAPARLTPDQVEHAWNYAYTFFAEYPQPFPWHLEKLGSSLEERPLSDVLSPAGRERYGSTFQQLAGFPGRMDRSN